MRPFFIQTILCAALAALLSTPAQAMLVSGPAHLDKALAEVRAGGILELAPSETPYRLKSVHGFAPANPVTITSADPAHPARFDFIWLRDAHNLRIDRVRFESGDSDRPAWQPDIFIQSSSRIGITNVVMRGLATAFNDGTVRVGRNALRAENSDGITFSGNDVGNYNFGLEFSQTSQVVLENNAIHSLQADGVQFVGASDVTIASNRFEQFLGSLHRINHTDMIQFATTGSTTASRNIVIRNNVLDGGSGSWTQSIFLGNEQVRDGAGLDMYYRDITIENNRISNNNWHGITLYESLNVSIAHNRVTTNKLTRQREFDSDGVYIIVADKSQNVSVLDNIADKIIVPPTTRVGGNTTLL